MNIVIVNKSNIVSTKIESLLYEFDIEGLDVELFSDAQEALDFIEDNDIDLVFSSIETDGIDGISFVEILLRNKPFLSSKLFIVTSQKNTDNFKDIKEIGAKRFIQKPINDEYFKHFVEPVILKLLKD